MAESAWYDKFAPLYDVGTAGDFFYRKPREVAIDQLDLGVGCQVADVFCGTGVDLPTLIQKVGTKGAVLAVDGSHEMLEQARSRAGKLHIDSNVEFLEADFSRSTGIGVVEAAITEKQPKHVFFSLGLTCLENWREFCSRIFDAAPSGTRFAIMDVYSNRLTLGARFINWIGAADCCRNVWKILEERCESFAWQEFRPFKILGVSVIVASGTKP
ncbi:class I SAM-dependent methyltransferase [Billgrantia gudaonensis]|uniref:Methyltransferase domain-containing protein n=1 Tax=Billgrantia gudaonensis TaxID=376427 RepID=A0A1G9EUU9_9GAMM|nr:methyltransferase domain-containing protein [Halomonas gudaonensis]SDK79919.1 Methyltransferase domain-containing protein [Halomonas gudaonensis]